MHIHWTIWAYSDKSEETYVGVSVITVVADDYKEALHKAGTVFPLKLKGGVARGAGFEIREVTVFEDSCLAHEGHHD